MKQAFLLLLLLCSFASCIQMESDVERATLKVDSFELSNGLKVFICTNSEQSTIHAQVVVRAGSRHDPPEATGLAHYLEHMLFKGTDEIGTVDFSKEKPLLDEITELYQEHWLSKNPEQRKAIMAKISQKSSEATVYSIPNDYDRIMQGLGATGVNAFTTTDETCYYADIPAHNFEAWAKLEAERFRKPVFRLFQTELEAVYEEKNASLDSRQTAAFEPLMKGVFHRHPYGCQTTLGLTEHLKSPSLKHMYQFYRDWYVPRNMAIILTGDISMSEAKRVLESEFGVWEERDPPELLLPVEESLEDELRLYVNFPSEQLVLAAYRWPAANHEDIAGLEVLDMLLDNGKAGLFNRNLNQPQKVLKAGCSPLLMHDHGMHYMYVYPLVDQTPEQALELMDEQIESLLDGEFEMTSVDAVINDLERSREGMMESNEELGSIVRDCFVQGVSINQWSQQIAKMRTYSHGDLRRLAKLYYSKGRAVVIRDEGHQEIERLDKPDLGEVKAGDQEASAFAVDLLSQRQEPKNKDFFDPKRDLLKQELTHGVKFVFNENPVNRLASLEIFIPKGYRHDSRLNHVAAIIKEAGCDGDTFRERSQMYYRLGMSFDLKVKANYTQIVLTALEKDMPEAIELFLEHLYEPEVSVELVSRWARKSRLLRSNAKKDTDFLRDALVEFARYGEQSRYVQAPTNELIDQITPKEILALWRELISYEYQLAYTAKDYEEVLGLLKDELDLSPRKNKPAAIYKKITNAERDSILFYHSPGVQSALSLNFTPAAFQGRKKNAMIKLYNEYFDGSLGSVVFQEIREKRSLAYSAFAHYFTVDTPGSDCLFTAKLNCQADKTEEALNEMKRIINDPPLSQERFESARQALVSQLNTGRIGFRERPKTYFRWLQSAWEGRNPKPFFIRALKNAKLEDIDQLIKNELKKVPLTITIMGDQSAIDLASLRRQAHLRYVHIDELFSY